MKQTFSNQNGILTIEKHKKRYGVILAGGDGTRLQSLTHAITGDERPKQFCPILNQETLLSVTRKRVNQKIAAENTLFVLTQKHERFYRSQLGDAHQNQLIVQSENKGTAPAILYSLLKLPPDAMVAFFPSDHYFSDDAAFMNHVETAFRAAERQPETLVLLGIEPEKAETSYGWIEPFESIFDGFSVAVSKVKRFWEKPSLASAQSLMLRGGLWNSFVMVGKVQTFLDVINRALPELHRMFKASSVTFGTSDEKSAMRSLYTWINETNFSNKVLETCAEELYVLRVSDVIWSDWGEPQRVLGTLAGLGIQTEWMRAAN